MKKTLKEESSHLILAICAASAYEGVEGRYLDDLELLDLLAAGIECSKECIQNGYKIQACAIAAGMGLLIEVIRNRGIKSNIAPEAFEELDKLKHYTKAVLDGHPLDEKEKRIIEDYMDVLAKVSTKPNKTDKAK